MFDLTLSDIAIFLVVLGVLVFVHELGHFLAAKGCGIYVDRFSLGMPPRIFGFKMGETDYCIGLLPIGGFVRMAGQEDAPLSEDEREQTYGHVPPERWFNNKPVWQRAIVLFAGPFMNLVLAFFVYAAMAAVGREVPLPSIDTRVGIVEANSPAASAPLFEVGADGVADLQGTPDAVGWNTADRIVRINGRPMTKFQDIFFEAVLGKGKTARAELERTGLDGTVTRYVSPIEPKVLEEGGNVTRFGFAPFSAALIDFVFPGSPAEANGLRSGDRILTADGKQVDAQSFSEMVRSLAPETTIELLVERGAEQLALSLTTRSEGRFEDVVFSPPLRPFLVLGESDQPVVRAEDEAFLARTGLKSGDRLVRINGDSNVGALLRESYDSGSAETFVAEVERPGRFGFGEPEAMTVPMTPNDMVWALTGSNPAGPVELAFVGPSLEKSSGVQRRDVISEVDGQPASARLLRELERDRLNTAVTVTVERPRLFFGMAQKSKRFEAELPISSVQQIGVVWGTEMTSVRSEPAQIIPAAWNECVTVIVQTYATLHRLLTGALSPKLMGGPVMIGDVVTSAARAGLGPLFEMMAMISVNLAIFNLLPLPVLDGGQLAFLGIEAVRRRPVSVKVMEAVQQVGILLILGLMVYVTFNDISRLAERWLP